ncbi:MAG: hypothetical protein IJS88_03145 [Alphaproteobacteria bacterium]|nr:hypothetical protein [Alphaproteobacteria bacterium]
MTEKKDSEGLKFLFRLDLAGADQDKLLELARASIEESKTHRTFSERKELITNPDSLKVNAARAHIKAMVSTDLSTNNKLYMIMERYVEIDEKKHPTTPRHKALDKFFNDFAKKYPTEYGAAKVEHKNTNQPIGLALHARGNSII